MTDNNEFVRENRIGKKQEIEIIIEMENGIIKKIHNSKIYQPTIYFKGETIKWHDESCVK